jgi:hypothetical protein
MPSSSEKNKSNIDARFISFYSMNDPYNALISWLAAVSRGSQTGLKGGA